ncbi:hypothetical protein [Bacillus amyloliquefaciens]|uniref:hypothetical protein n=1 Tax=Bacillus amyloliquefaciens TaxID=1390 RepID=UPI0022559E6D|nr:hypothetical protein [Bacillus amyloliquefaciens]MCX4184235.1 hypothetical protein [Bacillus amyloliquefaciens]
MNDLQERKQFLEKHYQEFKSLQKINTAASLDETLSLFCVAFPEAEPHRNYFYQRALKEGAE